MKIALFKDIKYGSIIVFQHSENTNNDSFGEHVRVSEFVDVEFPPRKQSEVISSEVKILDDVLNELMGNVHAIQTKKSELLALTYEGGKS